ncbi:MAG: glutamine-hydrolyzing carbamoyl-phosphate synthase small subunit [Pseudobacteriovorax sp.]|nr:glutamine-hydrolyzing carbamoyl-phosphate synthase small subunit [Pseudobacteriovorax sp.]
MHKCSLVLSSGSRFSGELIGAPLTSSGEIVFTTGMVGYSEAITDPSYFGQILCFTYPLIGNYGIPLPPHVDATDLPKGFESAKPQAAGVILTIDSPEAFHWNSIQSLDEWLKREGVPGVIGLDTRHLVQIIRSEPNLLGRIEPESAEGDRMYEGAFAPTQKTAFFDPGIMNVLDYVSRKEPITVGKGKRRVGLIDCGVKWNIVRQLVDLDCEVQLLPWDSDFSSVDCDYWLISNGPGDPTRTDDLIQRVSRLFDEDRPILGICLGHQILSLAAGALTKRMPYGHRSHNQPVYLVGTRKGYITSQNHSYVVQDNTLGDDWEVWFRNANDQSIEGIKHKTKPFRSIQFHPEASGGPQDTSWIFSEFLSEVTK